MGVLVEKHKDYNDNISLFYQMFQLQQVLNWTQVRRLPYGSIPEWHIIMTHLEILYLWVKKSPGNLF